MKLIKKTLLHYQKGNSNKVYNVYLYELSSKTYLVNFEYGRFGGNLREGTKTNEPVDLAKAQKIYDSLIVSKVNKEYLVKEEYDSTKQEEKRERRDFTLDEYRDSIISRLKRVGELGSGKLKKVDNYEVSRLIYRAGELKIVELKELIVDIYKLNTKESNAFYYSVAWALGRFRDSSLRPVLESLREKLDKSSKYIVEEALFMLNEEQEERHIGALTFPMPYADLLADRDIEGFVEEVRVLSDLINQDYQSYKNIESWYEEDRKKAKQALMPLLSQVDELYLKLYMWAVIEEDYKKAFNSIVHLLPITEFNFSLYRRLYKMAEMREDQEALGALVTLLESKKMSCYQSYDFIENKRKQSIGCSKEYFKKRSYRYLGDVGRYRKQEYIAFAKSTLLSANYFIDSFKPFKKWQYNNGWKKRDYDAFFTHINFMDILYGAGKRYKIESNKKQWEIVNNSIQNEYRPERYRELWDSSIDDVVDILVESSILEVQIFAFNILKDNPNALDSIPLERLLMMMNLQHTEARKLFFEVLKEKYSQTKDGRIIRAFLFSSDRDISSYALSQIEKDIELILMDRLILDVLRELDDRVFYDIVRLASKVENSRVIIVDVIDEIVKTALPLSPKFGARVLKILVYLSTDVTSADIVKLMAGEELTERHKLGAYLIRADGFGHLEIPLELKEKIAQFNDPEMLATTIYLLGKLSDQELMGASDMLVSFLYNQEEAVHKEAKKIIQRLGQDVESGRTFLKAIVENSFASASDDIAQNIEETIKSLNRSYSAIEPNQLYRMLIAKSRLAVRLGGLILTHYQATDFSVVQWARLAKNPNRVVRVWAYNAYRDNIEMVKEAMPKSLMIFDSLWEDTRAFACDYFADFDLNSDEIVVIADSNYQDVQLFAKRMIEQGDYDSEVILTKLSQHPAITVQKFVTDLMLNGMSNQQLIRMERFFNTLLHSVNQNRVAKTRVMRLLKEKIEHREIAEMYARLASHHSATMVWADRELFVEAMSYIAEVYPTIELPLSIVEVEQREVV